MAEIASKTAFPSPDYADVQCFRITEGDVFDVKNLGSADFTFSTYIIRFFMKTIPFVFFLLIPVLALFIGITFAGDGKKLKKPQHSS